MAEKHRHYWMYPHAIWDGRHDREEIAVSRWCDCGVVQIAYATRWHTAPRDHDCRKEAARG